MRKPRQLKVTFEDVNTNGLRFEEVRTVKAFDRKDARRKTLEKFPKAKILSITYLDNDFIQEGLIPKLEGEGT